jgi:hypothetical protein
MARVYVIGRRARGAAAGAALNCLIMGETKAQASGVKPFLDRLHEGVVVCDGAMGCPTPAACS